jgi:O-antigen/teichoic acid export membrane protein
MAPFLISRLGDDVYGLWVLMLSITESLGLLDLGVRSSVGRQLAFYRSKGDTRAANAVLNSALIVTFLVGAVVCLASFMLAYWFPWISSETIAPTESTRRAMAIVGLSFAAYSMSSVFDGSLWALQRFDTLNIIDIPIQILKAGSMYVAVDHGYGIEALAWTALLSNALTGIAKAVLSLRLDPTLKLGVAYFSWIDLRGLFGYGSWNLATTLGSKLKTSIAPAIITSSHGVALVTPYWVAIRLVAYAALAMQASTGVLTPVATAFDAQEKRGHLQRLILEGGKFCALLAVFLTIWIIAAGHYFIMLWIGPRLAESSAFATILVIGEFLPMSQLAGQSVILATAKHRVLAFWSICEGLIGAILAIVLIRAFGIAGLCIGMAIAAFICRGLAILIYSCRLNNVGITEYLTSAVIPPLGAAILPAVALWIAIRLHPPDTWLRLVGYSTMFAVMFAISSLPLWHRLIRGKSHTLHAKLRGAFGA